MDEKDKVLLDNFINSILTDQARTNKLFAIGFLGLIGMGKSTVAHRLGKKLNIYVASTDEVKRFLNDHGHSGIIPYPELSQKINMESSAYLYKKGLSHVIDGDLTRFHQPARKNAAKHGVELLIIDINCDEAVILERLKKRDELIEKYKDIDMSQVSYAEIGHSLSGTVDYLERKKLYLTIDKPQDIYYTLDTSAGSIENIDLQLDELIEKMKGDGLVV